MKIINDTLKTLEGKDLQNSSTPPGAPPLAGDPALLISDVLTNTCLAPAAPGQPYTPKASARRYELAVSLFGKGVGDEIEVPAELAVELDNDIARFYPVIVSGQMHKLLK
jgi:hypothetical protein